MSLCNYSHEQPYLPYVKGINQPEYHAECQVDLKKAQSTLKSFLFWFSVLQTLTTGKGK